MNDNLVENLTSQAKSLYGPLGKINALMVKNAEKVAEFQMGAMKSYAELAMKQWKQVAEIRDIDGLKEFGTAQGEMMSGLSEKITEDMKSFGEIGTEFKSEIEEIISEARAPKEDAEPTEAKASPKSKAAPKPKASSESKESAPADA